MLHPSVLLLALLLPSDTTDPVRLDPGLLESLKWRNIGPASMGGRVVDLAVHPEKRRIFYVASATGGLFKTENAGTTFTPVFDQGGSASLGTVALAPSDPEVVWIGTGEANPRNSVSWGDGVYRSLDGGKSWAHLGLKATRHIGRIAIHPDDPQTVFVAALGSTWGANPERGLFRTRDGGDTWQKVLFVDADTGCVDVRIDPTRPEIVYAATYQRRRDMFDSNDPAVRTGKGSGIWRSMDGGESFERLHVGLPTIDIGRIGLDLFLADPRILYAVIETARTGERGAPPRSEDRVSLGIRGEDHDQGFLVNKVTAGETAGQAGLQEGDIVIQVDDTTIVDRASLVEALAGYKPGETAVLAYLREEQETTIPLDFLGRLLRSRTRSFAGSQGGQVADAQDEQGRDGFETGGIFRSEDRGTTWTRINSLNPRPFYYSQIRVDPTDERYLYVLGIEFHASDDGGKTFQMKSGRGVHSDHHALWIDPRDPEYLVLGNDGGIYVTHDRIATWEHVDTLAISQFYNVAVDLRQPYRVYGGLQDNGSWSGPSATRTGNAIRSSDWIRINGGDGFRCAVDPSDQDIVYSESQGGMMMRLNLRTGEQARVSRPQGRGDTSRFNWNTPFLLSPHNPSILYYAGERVYRSIDRGESHEVISEEFTATDRGSATALAESPLLSGLLYVGSDDGALWMSDNGGRKWVSLLDRLPGIGQPLYVSAIEASRFREGRVYVTLDGHRSDDYAPHVFVSEDYGESWRALDATLPGASVRTLVEDPDNENLLFVGTETGCFVSIDRGDHWTPFESGLPTVPVHDLVIHPRDADLIAGTHGRGAWIADIAPLKEITAELLAGPAHLFAVEPARLWNRLPAAEESGSRQFTAPNPRRGASIHYFLPESFGEEVQMVVQDAVGTPIRNLEGPGDAGLHRIVWDLRGQARRGGGNRPAQRGGRGGGAIEPGDYAVSLKVGDNTLVQRIRVLPDPLTDANRPALTR